MAIALHLLAKANLHHPVYPVRKLSNEALIIKHVSITQHWCAWQENIRGPGSVCVNSQQEMAGRQSIHVLVGLQSPTQSRQPSCYCCMKFVSIRRPTRPLFSG